MHIVLNGNQEILENEISLQEFLLGKGLNLDTIIVEYNCNIVKKHEWPVVILKENDCLEVLKFVGGG